MTGPNCSSHRLNLRLIANGTLARSLLSNRCYRARGHGSCFVLRKSVKKKKIGVLCVRNFVIQTVCIHLHIEKSLLGCVKSFGLKKEVKITPTPRASRCTCTFNRLCRPNMSTFDPWPSIESQGFESSE